MMKMDILLIKLDFKFRAEGKCAFSKGNFCAFLCKTR